MELKLKKRVRKKAMQQLKNSMPKQEVYESLVEEFGHRESVAKILMQFLPSKKAWKKYGIWNHILSGILIFFFFVIILGGSSVGSILWFGLPTLVVLMRKTRFYFWVVIFSSFGIIGSTVHFFVNYEQGSEIIIGIIFLILLVPVFFLGIWLPKKLTPKPIEEREFYENEHGESRSRISFQFQDD